MNGCIRNGSGLSVCRSSAREMTEDKKNERMRAVGVEGGGITQDSANESEGVLSFSSSRPHSAHTRRAEGADVCVCICQVSLAVLQKENAKRSLKNQ